MFPFESRWRWVLHSGYLHLVEAIEERMDLFHEPYRSILERRARGLRVAVSARTVVLVLLNIGIIARIATEVLAFLPAVETTGTISAIATSLTALSLVFTGLFLLLSRYLGQLQADAVACMALGTPGAPPVDASEEERLRGLEDDSSGGGWLPPIPSGRKYKTWRKKSDETEKA